MHTDYSLGQITLLDLKKFKMKQNQKSVRK